MEGLAYVHAGQPKYVHLARPVAVRSIGGGLTSTVTEHKAAPQ